MKSINEYVNTLISAKRYDILVESSDNNDYENVRKMIKLCDDQYLGKIIKIYKSVIKNIEYLKSRAYNNFNNIRFYFDRHDNDYEIYLRLDSYVNYAYNGGFSTYSGKEAVIEKNKFKEDMLNLKNQLSVALKPLNMTVRFIGYDNNGNMVNLSEFFKILDKSITEKSKDIPDLTVTCFIIPTEGALNKLKQKTFIIKENDKKKYLSLYDKFANFIKNPHKLSGDFCAYHISDICKIINMSSKRLNELVSNNIKPIGIQKTFKDNDDFYKYLKKIIGNYYIIDYDGESEYIFYSINKKKMYYVDFEHEECEIFYNNYPFDSDEFGDLIHNNNIEPVRSLFKEYDAQKNYNLFQ